MQCRESYVIKQDVHECCFVLNLSRNVQPQFYYSTNNVKSRLVFILTCWHTGKDKACMVKTYFVKGELPSRRRTAEQCYTFALATLNFLLWSNKLLFSSGFFCYHFSNCYITCKSWKSPGHCLVSFFCDFLSYIMQRLPNYAYCC